MPYLTDRERQALQLADDLQLALARWLAEYGIAGVCPISPYVDQAGQPAVLIRMDNDVAQAVLSVLAAATQRPVNPYGSTARP